MGKDWTWQDGLKLLIKGGASEIPILGGLLSEVLGEVWKDDRQKTDLLFLAAKVRQHETILDALTDALANLDPDDRFRPDLLQGL